MNALPDAATVTASSQRFVAARRAAQSLPDYPGSVPHTLGDAYARQDLAIQLWPDAVVGWKVGKIPDDWVPKLGEERLVGPVFGRQLQRYADGESLALPVIAGGFAAVEAEYVFVLGADADPARTDWTVEDCGALVAALHLGIEFAGSPLSTINVLGPAVVVSDFGNNAGVLLGPEVPQWPNVDWNTLACETWIEDRCVGRGGAMTIAGTPLAALAFALNRNARRGLPLRAGMLVSTGASTGIHDIVAGQRAEVRFAGGTVLRCHAVTATPAVEIEASA